MENAGLRRARTQPVGLQIAVEADRVGQAGDEQRQHQRSLGHDALREYLLQGYMLQESRAELECESPKSPKLCFLGDSCLVYDLESAGRFWRGFGAERRFGRSLAQRTLACRSVIAGLDPAIHDELR